MYIKMKNKEAPLRCRDRVAHPLFLSRIMVIIEEKAFSVSGMYIIDTSKPDII